MAKIDVGIGVEPFVQVLCPGCPTPFTLCLLYDGNPESGDST